MGAPIGPRGQNAYFKKDLYKNINFYCRERWTLSAKLFSFMRGPRKVYEWVYERKKIPAEMFMRDLWETRFLRKACWEALRGPKRRTDSKRISKGFPRVSKGFVRVPKGSQHFEWFPKDVKRFLNSIPKDFKGFEGTQRIPRDSKGTKVWMPKDFQRMPKHF